MHIQVSVVYAFSGVCCLCMFRCLLFMHIQVFVVYAYSGLCCLCIFRSLLFMHIQVFYVLLVSESEIFSLSNLRVELHQIANP